MGRWGPNTRGRLEEAALTLYLERGFDQTTVAEIAERAGLTERTFFRHFADKREVLFGSAGALERLVVGAMSGAPHSAAPIEVVAVGLEAAGTVFEQNVLRSRRRQAVIAGHAELQARELSKLASLAAAVGAALRARGVPEPAAGLTAEAGIVIFRAAFERWTGGDGGREWAPLLRETLDELRAVVVGGPSAVDSPGG